MSVRAIVVTFLALICGASAATGVLRHRAPSEETPTAVETAPVLVAAEKVARGQVLTAKDLTVRQWPKHALPEGVLTTPEEALDRAVLSPLVLGEPVLAGKLAPKDAGRGLAALVPSGMRAYAISVARAASGVAGFVLPGNKVDVLLSLRGNLNDENGGGSTRTLLQSVEILAVDQSLDPPADNKMTLKEMSSVTLLVTPEQANLLDLGQSMGQLSLALRNPDDKTQTTSAMARLADVRGDGDKAAKEEKPKEEQPEEEKGKMRLLSATEVAEATPLRKPASEYTITTLRGIYQHSVRVTDKPQQ